MLTAIACTLALTAPIQSPKELRTDARSSNFDRATRALDALADQRDFDGVCEGLNSANRAVRIYALNEISRVARPAGVRASRASALFDHIGGHSEQSVHPADARLSLTAVSSALQVTIRMPSFRPPSFDPDEQKKAKPKKRSAPRHDDPRWTESAVQILALHALADGDLLAYAEAIQSLPGADDLHGWIESQYRAALAAAATSKEFAECERAAAVLLQRRDPGAVASGLLVASCGKDKAKALSPELAERLTVLLRDSRVEIRTRAAVVWIRREAPDGALREALVSLLGDEEEAPRLAAAAALAHVGYQHDALGSLLDEALGHDEPYFVALGVHGLGGRTELALERLGAIEDAIRSKHAGVRIEAYVLAGELGTGAASLARALDRAAKREEHRHLAAFAKGAARRVRGE